MEMNEVATVALANLKTDALSSNGILNVLLLRAGTTTDLTSYEDVYNRIYEFIHIHSLNNTPLSLATVNRRFSKVAKRFETTTSGILTDLSVNDKVVWLALGAKRYAYSSAVWAERIEALADVGNTEADLTATLLSNAL